MQHRLPSCTFVSLVVKAFDFSHQVTPAQKKNRAAYTSRNFQALIKIYVRLVIYPIYSVVKYRPRWPCQLSRLSGYGSYSLQNLTNLRPLHDSEVPPTQCSTPILLTPNIRLNGGADRDRTGGLLVANQALSQLSYSPNPSGQWSVASGQKNRADH